MGRSHTTAFRLSGIRARDDAAESDVAMASNDNKKKARRLQQENPGMKYTEALRQVESGGVSNLDPKGPELLHDALRARGEDATSADLHEADEVSNLDPLWFAEGPSADEEKKARWLQRTNPGLGYEEALRIVRQPLAPGYIQALDEWVILAKARKTPRFDPRATLEWDPKTGNITVLDEVHTIHPNGESKKEVADWLDRLARQARHSPQRENPQDRPLPVLTQSLSDIAGHLDGGGQWSSERLRRVRIQCEGNRSSRQRRGPGSDGRAGAE